MLRQPPGGSLQPFVFETWFGSPSCNESEYSCQLRVTPGTPRSYAVPQVGGVEGWRSALLEGLQSVNYLANGRADYGSRSRVSDSCCNGHLEVAALQARQRRVLKWVLAINVTTCAMMIVGAILSGSSSLLSGSLDNLGDALT